MDFVIDRRITVKAPADVVWSVLTDLPRYPDWNPFVRECASTLKPGEEINMTVSLGGQLRKVSEVILDFKPGRHFAYRMKPYPLGALSSYRSHEVEAAGAAESRYRSRFELRGWLKPLVLRLFRPALEESFAAMTEAVGRRAEELWAQQQRSRPAA